MRINLLIDANNYFYGSSNIQSYATRNKMKYPKTSLKLESPESFEIFKDKIEVEFRLFLNSLPEVHRVYFLRDQSSWRKDVYIRGAKTYKANRKHVDIYWEHFNQGIDYLTTTNSIFRNVSINKLEADDLMFLMSQKLLEESEKNLVIIVSTDGDFLQLLKPRVIIYNPHYTNRRFILPDTFTLKDLKEYELQFERNDLSILEKINNPKSKFDVSGIKHTLDSNNQKLYETIKKDFEFEVSNNHDSICYKVLENDDKDNVPSVYQWENSNGTKTRVTKKFIEPIEKYFKENNIIFSVSNLIKNFDDVHRILEEVTKQNISITELKSNFKENIILKVLSKKTIPQKYQDKFDILYKELE